MKQVMKGKQSNVFVNVNNAHLQQESKESKYQ